MKRDWLYFLFVLMGFFLVSNPTYGCGTKQMDSEISISEFNHQNKEDNDCCADKNNDCKERENNCNGNCNNKTCHNTTTIIIGFYTSSSSEIPFSRIYKEDSLNFFYLENNFPLAYFSIWTPPKIV